MKAYTAIFDFSLYPYALGDILTWNVRTAMAAHNAGVKSCRLVVFADPALPHCKLQDRPTAEQFELFQCEIQPVFYSHPCASTFHFFHDRSEFDSYLHYLCKEGELSETDLTTYEKAYAARDDHAAVLEHFRTNIGFQHPINSFFQKHGFIPKPKEIVGAKYDVEAFIAAQDPGTILVATQFRMRSLDQSIPCEQSIRDADLLVWQDFLMRCDKELPHVKFVLLGRLQEKHLNVLARRNVITPRTLGFNLAHEISLLLRSDFFIGSSSGFAQLANFSDVPYRISKVSQQACEFYGIPFETDRLPFAKANQRLLYGPETVDGLFKALTQGLSKCAPRPSLATSTFNDRDRLTTSRFFLNAAQGQHEAATLLQPYIQNAITATHNNRPAEIMAELQRINSTLTQLKGGIGPGKDIRVGMLMPNFNHGPFLGHAFKQMAEQTRPLDEIVVVDDGSTDNSVEQIKTWKEKSPSHKILLLPKNGGVDPAIQAGLDQITTDFFAPRSVDDTFYPKHIECIAEMAKAYPHAGVITFRSLRFDERQNKRFLGPQLANTARYFSPQEAEVVLRNNYLWDACIAWNTAAFKNERTYDWRLRWIASLHLADVLAFRHGFCYVPEPQMEYNMRPHSFSSGGHDQLRHAEAFLASARDWSSPGKAAQFSAHVRSGFLGLRENAHIPIRAVLNGPWTDHGKPFLLILHGLIHIMDQAYAKHGIATTVTPRKELAELAQIISGYNNTYNEEKTFRLLGDNMLALIPATVLNNDFIGFYSSYLIRTGSLKEAHTLLHTKLVSGKRCKSVLRATAELATHVQGREAGDRLWREALSASKPDVWFGMEFARLLVARGETGQAHDLARDLVETDGKADVLKELREILPDFSPEPPAQPVPVAKPAETDKPLTPPLAAKPAPTAVTPALAAAPLHMPSSRPPVRLLFVTEKWAEQPGGPLTNSFHNLFGSFKATGFGVHENFFIEEHADVDTALVRHCRASKPDLLVISCPTHHPKTPKTSTYQHLHEAGHRLAFIWWDAINPHIMALADEVAPYCHGNFILDHNSFQKDSRYLPLWTPQDPELYHNPGLERTIDVSFAGSLAGLPERQHYLQFLHDKGLPVVQAGGQREQNLSCTDYARIYQKSKITLNFTKNRLDRYQTKGRAWEALACGTLLFEQDNPEIRRWLTPWTDYIPFTTPEELIANLKDFLARPERIAEYARKGEASFNQRYTATHWWNLVLDHCLKDQLSMPASTSPDAEPTNNEIFSNSEFDYISALLKEYQGDPEESTKRADVLALRRELAGFLLDAEPASLPALFAGNFGRVYRLFLGCPRSAQALDPADEEIISPLLPRLASKSTSPADLRPLLVFTLFRAAHHLPLSLEPDCIPDWFMDDYLGYMLSAPQSLGLKGEADRYLAHLLAWVRMLTDLIKRTPKAPLTQKLAGYTTFHLNLITVYFTDKDVKELMTLRAGIISFTLREAGSHLNAHFPRRPQGKGKIRVGFLNAHFGSQTETYTTLPTLNIDRSKFEIHLFALRKGDGPLIDHCTKLSDRFIELPNSLPEQVQTIRSANLDILLIGTNVTAVTNQITLLALHKLAPIQIATSSSPMTTGMHTMDGYLSGTVRGFDAHGDHYTEKLVLVDASISCLEFSIDAKPAVVSLTRKSAGIPEEAMVFVSGANFYKITPELRETWAKILQKTPGSYLLLHPFNPNWSNQYPIKQFERQMKAVLTAHGVEPSRLLLSKATLPSRADVCSLMALGDVYLDSYPLSGSVSLVDPLQVGVPPVIWHGNTLRSLMAASMLCDLDCRELLTHTEGDYIALAVRLAEDPLFRRRLSSEIKTKMAQAPRFFACSECGKEVSAALETLIHP